MTIARIYHYSIGLSLGRLNMNLIEIQGLLDEEIAGLGLQATFKIRASIIGRMGNSVFHLSFLKNNIFVIFSFQNFQTKSTNYQVRLTQCPIWQP